MIGLVLRPWRQVQRHLLRLAPVSLTLALVLLGCLPLGLPYLSSVMPLLAVMAVYYWSIFRPELMPAAAAFGIGLVQDALGGGPLGLMALVLVAVRGICFAQRKVFFRKSFLVGWFGLGLVAAGATFGMWLVATIYYMTLINPAPGLIQLAITIVLYPAVSWLFNRTEQSVLRWA